MPLIPARLARAEDGTLWSAHYDDVYHAAAGGLEQARHVFLGGNDLPTRWRGRDAFAILETGFGCGLNFLATWSAWHDDPARCARLHYVSVEKHPFSRDDLREIHRNWPELAPLSAGLLAAWPTLVSGFHRLDLDGGRVSLTLLLGDALDLLPQLRASIDAFYLDGFAPSKNAALWSPNVFRQVGRLAAAGATAATWSVAAAVPDGLAEAGFACTRRPGFATKREMLTARRERKVMHRFDAPTDRRALVIGAGIAGSGCAQQLARRGWDVDLIEQADAPARGASGNLAGVLRPVLSLDDNRLSRLTRAAFLHARRHLARLERDGHAVRWRPCGVLQLARDARHEITQRATIERHAYPADYARFAEREEATYLLGHLASAGGWHFPGGAWVNPPSVVHANIADGGTRIRLHLNTDISSVAREGDNWQAVAADGTTIASAPVLVIATGADTLRIQGAMALPLRRGRGQVSLLRAHDGRALNCVVTRRGYATPAVDGWHCAGATFDANDTSTALAQADHAVNLAHLEAMLPGFSDAADAQALHGRVGFRPASPDKRPMVGSLPCAHGAGATTALWKVERLPGVLVVNGFGARGLVWSALCGELLAAQLEGEPLPLEGELADALDPARFALHGARRDCSDGDE